MLYFQVQGLRQPPGDQSAMTGRRCSLYTEETNNLRLWTQLPQKLFCVESVQAFLLICFGKSPAQVCSFSLVYMALSILLGLQLTHCPARSQLFKVNIVKFHLRQLLCEANFVGEGVSFPAHTAQPAYIAKRVYMRILQCLKKARLVKAVDANCYDFLAHLGRLVEWNRGRVFLAGQTYLFVERYQWLFFE